MARNLKDMKKVNIKKLFVVIAIACLINLLYLQEASASEVYYKGEVDKFIFYSQSDYGDKELLFDMKDLMPGDVLAQRLNLINDDSQGKQIHIYVRSVSPYEGEDTFLSQLLLKVLNFNGETLNYESTLEATKLRTQWQLVGDLKYGQESFLDLVLEIPITMNNEFANKLSSFDWEFKVEVYDEDESSSYIKTGDDKKIILLAVATAISLTILIALVATRKGKSYK